MKTRHTNRMSELPGTFGVSRSSDGNIYLEVRCESSGITFVRMRMTPADFAEGVTGLHSSKCTLDVAGLDKVGKQHECRTVHVVAYEESIFRLKKEQIGDDLWTLLTQTHMPGGWVVDKHNWGNHHKQIREKDLKKGEVGGYYCTARRWV